MQIKTTVRNRIKFPEVLVKQEDLKAIADEIIIGFLIRGIDTSESIVGGGLPHNEPETVKRKGHGRQLIETGTLRRSFYSKERGKNKVVVTIENERKKIGQYLQEGIMTKHGLKQYLFFGISEVMYKESMRLLNSRIEYEIKKFNGSK